MGATGPPKVYASNMGGAKKKISKNHISTQIVDRTKRFGGKVKGDLRHLPFFAGCPSS